MSAGRPAEVHRPTDACWDTHCSWHNLDEDAESAYRVCFECGHVYRTAEELREAWAEVMPGDAAPPADQIYACPYCCHDW